MNTSELKKIAKQMVAPGKGLIAADESAGTCAKRFDSVGIPCTEDTRRAYRGMLFATPDLEKYVSGVILYDETIRQSDPTGMPFTEVLNRKGILPGIKVDAGTSDLANHPGEKVTEGLDKLRERLKEYAAMGAKFAKWRAVITIGKGIPTAACIHANAHALARYAALCQEAGIVPIIEPEVLIDGNHTIEQSYKATLATLKETFKEMANQKVMLEGVILKASMVISGKSAKKQSKVKDVAKMTVKCLKASVPKKVAGVVFLSGGQGDEQATAHLSEMNKMGPGRAGKLPWALSFSYSRAIQNPVLKKWAENPDTNVQKAQEILFFRSKMNGLASLGKYSDDMETQRPY